MISTLVLIGSHGAGKTTLGQGVAARLGWCFDEEIGARLREAALREDLAAHAARSPSGFDWQVSAREILRDLRRWGRGPRVVETWHPGNLAYAERRDPAAARDLEPLLRWVARRPGTRLLVQPLVLGHDAAQARRHEPGPPDLTDWFLAVGASALAIARGWRLPVAEPIRTDRCSTGEAIEQIVLRIGGSR